MTLPRSRIPRPVEVLAIRPIVREDLSRLVGPRDKSGAWPAKLRASHHRVAELLAMGFPLTDVALMTGYNYNRITTLARSPAMQELIAVKSATKAEMTREVYDAFAEYATGNMLAAERQISDHIAAADESGDLLPMRELLAIASDRADRFGYGKKSTNVNVNVDFAARLEAAIARSDKVVECPAVARTPAAGLATAESSSPLSPLSPQALSSPLVPHALLSEDA